ncbi:hypothetical protein [Nostoc sp.]
MQAIASVIPPKAKSLSMIIIHLFAAELVSAEKSLDIVRWKISYTVTA